MRTIRNISRATTRTKSDIKNGKRQAANSPHHGTDIPSQRHAKDGPDNGCQQWQSIGKIRRASNAAGRDGHAHRVTDPRAGRVVDPICLVSAAEHLRQALTATASLLVAPAAAAGLDFNDGLTAVHRTNNGADGAHFLIHTYHRRSGAVSSKGRSLAATASRARKMRERTVPIGQSMMAAISS